MKPRYVLTDIEGTTTPISFVHDVLFPYSAKYLPQYVADHKNSPPVRQCLEATKQTVSDEEGRKVDDDGATTQLLRWIEQDRKHPALKSLQGLIWRYGYESSAFTSVVYPDVAPALVKWTEQGIRLGVYSSGSVEAQILLFKYSDAGDLTPLFTEHFDTAVGGKREPQSYERIAAHLSLPAAEVLFLSDIAEELDAAKSIGMQTVQLLRPGTKPSGRHETAATFDQIKL